MKQQLVFWSRYTVLNDSYLLLRVMPLCVARQVVPDGLTKVFAQVKTNDMGILGCSMCLV